MWKYVLAWIPMVFIAIINGAIREGWYGKHVSELQAHQISTATGVLLFGVYIWVLVRIWRPASTGQAITIGLVWQRTMLPRSPSQLTGQQCIKFLDSLLICTLYLLLNL